MVSPPRSHPAEPDEGKAGRLSLSPSSAGTNWMAEAFDFLEQHPRSTLLSVVQHLWPDYLKLPEARRVECWYWIESEFQWLTYRGLLQSHTSEDGVVIWSLRGSPSRWGGDARTLPEGRRK